MVCASFHLSRKVTSDKLLLKIKEPGSTVYTFLKKIRKTIRITTVMIINTIDEIFDNQKRVARTTEFQSRRQNEGNLNHESFICADLISDVDN